MDEVLRSRYDCKSGGILGPGAEDDKEVIYLNRVFSYASGSSPQIEIDHDVRRKEHSMRDLGRAGAKVKALDCPSVKVGMQETQRRTTGASLEPAETTKHRSGVMRVAYLLLDRPDLVHAAKCLS
eukprot:4523531-Amphidinium_carterae.2